MEELFKKGDRVSFKQKDKYDAQSHTVLNVQKTPNDVCYFLHYWSWVDEDELELVEDNNNNNMQVEVGKKYKWGEQGTEEDTFIIDSIKGSTVNYTYLDGTPGSESILGTWFNDAVLVEEPTKDNIVNPAHYTTTKISALDVVNDWDLGFYLGNTIKYIKRYKLKGNPIQDLKKGIQYMQLLVDKLEKENEEEKAND